MNRASRRVQDFDAEMFTEKQLSRRWQIDPRTLSNWRYQGRGPAYLKIGTSVRYLRSVILKFEAASAVTGLGEES
jgi:hypothetical protein